MKHIFTFIMIMALGLPVFGQSDYNNLLEMLVDEKYEKLLYRAEKYTLDDKTKKHPMPYLYMSMAFNEISKLDEMQEKYPKAFKDALKYAAKYRSKDKQADFVAEHQEYLDELLIATISEAEVFVEMEKYTSAKMYYNYLVKIAPDDPGSWILLGFIQTKLRSKRDATESFTTAKELIAATDCSHMTDPQMDVLRIAIIVNSESMDSAGDRNGAREWLEIGKKYFGDNNEFNVTYEMIAG